MVSIIFQLISTNYQKKYDSDRNGDYRRKWLDSIALLISISPKPQYCREIVYKRRFVDDFHEFYNKPPPSA